MLLNQPINEVKRTASHAIETPVVEAVGRRAFLKNGTLFMAAACSMGHLGPFVQSSFGKTNLGLSLSERGDSDQAITIGLITDLHYADKPVAGTRFYRETPLKLAEAAEHFGGQKLDFLVELGDLIDAADDVETEKGYLSTIDGQFAPICKNRHYVLGNHCVTTLTKAEFLEQVEQEKSYYSFDSNGVHFVVLDSCFRSDGEPYGRKNFTWTDANIPQAELDWLQNDLQKTDKPTIVFAHQRLDEAHSHRVRNAPAVRKIFEQSEKVTAVFQGHSHKNEYQEIGGVHYCTLVAMVEGKGKSNSGFSTLTVAKDGTLRLEGFVKQKTYKWPSTSP